MNEMTARRLTGGAGIAAAVALIVEVPLYFVYSAPPPDANVLARLLIGIIALAFLLVFVTAFRDLVKRVHPDYEWAGSLAFTAGLVYTTITLVSSGLEAAGGRSSPPTTPSTRRSTSVAPTSSTARSPGSCWRSS